MTEKAVWPGVCPAAPMALMPGASSALGENRVTP